MYSKAQLAKKYISYLLKSDNSKGHGIHSPFVYDFVRNVLMDKREYDAYAPIEGLRTLLKKDERVLTIQDFGAGSRVNGEKKRSVEAIAKSALKPRKYAQLLYRIARYYKPQSLVELGTSLGITSSYLAASNPTAQLFTFEGAKEVANVAQENLDRLFLHNAKITLGNFDETFPSFLQKEFSGARRVDFAFLDGNHREEPTVRYFEDLLPYIHDHSILIFDDIHWSSDMENAWARIQSHPEVSLTIDLFFIGLVFFRKENKEKEHFTIRY